MLRRDVLLLARPQLLLLRRQVSAHLLRSVFIAGMGQSVAAVLVCRRCKLCTSWLTAGPHSPIDLEPGRHCCVLGVQRCLKGGTERALPQPCRLCSHALLGLQHNSREQGATQEQGACSNPLNCPVQLPLVQGGALPQVKESLAVNTHQSAQMPQPSQSPSPACPAGPARRRASALGTGSAGRGPPW